MSNISSTYSPVLHSQTACFGFVPGRRAAKQHAEIALSTVLFCLLLPFWEQAASIYDAIFHCWPGRPTGWPLLIRDSGLSRDRQNQSWFLVTKRPLMAVQWTHVRMNVTSNGKHLTKARLPALDSWTAQAVLHHHHHHHHDYYTPTLGNTHAKVSPTGTFTHTHTHGDMTLMLAVKYISRGHSAKRNTLLPQYCEGLLFCHTAEYKRLPLPFRPTAVRRMVNRIVNFVTMTFNAISDL